MDSMLKVIKTTENQYAEEKKMQTGQLDSDLNNMNQSASDFKTQNLLSIKDALEFASK